MPWRDRRRGEPRRTPQQVWAEWQAADEAGDADAAGRLAVEMTEVAPASYHAWFEAGLYSKARRDWDDSMVRNRRAVDLFTTDIGDEYDGMNPAAWNLGIAATALGDWTTARSAWTAYGVEGIASGAAPIDGGFGFTPVRLNPDRANLPHQAPVGLGATEVVWCWRRSPAHAVIASVPLPESGHRFRDVLLIDGQPNGVRQLDGQQVSVFDELQRLETSGTPTWQAEVLGALPGDVESLTEVLEADGLGVDDWSGIRMMCAGCSHGSPDDSHEHAPAPTGSTLIGLAGLEDPLRLAVDSWLASRPHLSMPALQLVW